MSAVALSASSVRPDCLRRLRVLRDEAKLRSLGIVRVSIVSEEWARLSREHRLVVLLMAGIDEAEDVILKDWSEYSLPEKQAIQSVVRELKVALSGLVALVRR